MEEELINTFLTCCANRVCRKFWIGRAYDYVRFYSEDETVRLWGNTSHFRIPRNIRDTPYLGVVAAIWELETRYNRSPTRGEMAHILEVSGCSQTSFTPTLTSP